MSEQPGGLVASATAQMGETRYAVTLRTGHHSIVADEPRSGGGDDAGPSPFGLLLASLASCTAITLRMYAERKNWPLGDIGVATTFRWLGETPHIDRVLSLAGLDEAQRARCAEIAEKTPVTRTLKRGIEIETRLR